MSRVELHLRPPIRLSDEDAEGLRAAVAACTVHNSILHPPRIGVHLEPQVAAV